MDWKAFWNDSPQVHDPDLGRQVGRTFQQVSYSEGQLDFVAARLLTLVDASADKTLLDLACGNGLVTSRLASQVRRITGVDFSCPLIEIARTRCARSNVDYVVGDAVALEGVRGRYDCVVISAAFQFFDTRQARKLLQGLAGVVADRGRVVLGDVADGDRIWKFYRGVGGRVRYVLDLIRRRPIIGHWWRPDALRRIAREAGWTTSIHYQPADLPNHYFRYDAVLERVIPEASASERDRENPERTIR
jgi:ubiquinone/menaquinone biosynthesis C-methylase UbiE